MKNNIILLFSLICCGSFYSQVGVNTPNPQGVFNIDGAKDNPKTGTGHTVAQQLIDVTVLANGNVGLGTINPSTKLEIQTGGTAAAQVAGFKLVDGYQANGAILVSDAAGAGLWTILGSAKGTINGKVDGGGTVASDQSGGTKYTMYKLDLTQGTYIVNMGLVLHNTMNVPVGDGTWLHGYISSDPGSWVKNGFKLDGPAGGVTGYASVQVKNSTPNSPNFFSGTINLTVLNPTITLYLLIENIGRGGGATTGSLWEHNTARSGNYFYAIPVNK